MRLAIKGHATRGDIVIKTLEMLGGKNIYRIDAIRDYYIYFVMGDKNKTISSLKLNQVLPEQFIIYSLEEFLEKFPYKVGDKVQHKGATSCGSIFEVEEMQWEENTVKYTLCLFGCNYKRSTLPAEYLQPYQEETMEERKSINLNELEQQLDEASSKETTESLNKWLDGEPQPKAPILSNRYDYAEGKCGYVIPDGYEFDSIKQGFQTEIILRPIKPQYPKTYAECCYILDIDFIDNDAKGYKYEQLYNLQKLLICRDAYWKIAGDWKPDLQMGKKKWSLMNKENRIIKVTTEESNRILTFPTEEMRDAFYENFIDLINECKDFI